MNTTIAVRVPNRFGEMLDVVVEGKFDAMTTVLFVHGFGTNMDESGNYFTDLGAELGKLHRIIRFSFAGYGKSEGKQENVTLWRQVTDLKAILEFVKKGFPGKIHILAHSMGAIVTSLLCPDGVGGKAIFTGIPNPDLGLHRAILEKAIRSREGGVFNPEGISLYPRTSGEMQKIGPSYWNVLDELRQSVILGELDRFAWKVNLTIIHPKQDEIVGNTGMEFYHRPFVSYMELPGSHNFRKPEDRHLLIETVKQIFEG